MKMMMMMMMMMMIKELKRRGYDPENRGHGGRWEVH